MLQNCTADETEKHKRNEEEIRGLDHQDLHVLTAVLVQHRQRVARAGLVGASTVGPG
jgi:hypothetical protein